ncbi:MAG: hypothetical protein ACOC2A_03505 [Halanaeroarchaeum sp.]
MSNSESRFADTLEPLGTVVGGLLVLMGLGTIVGMPWATNGDLAASIVQILGILATMGVGVGLVWLSRQTA